MLITDPNGMLIDISTPISSWGGITRAA
jgi:hypothetical protein